MGGPENGNFPLLYVVKCPYVGGWVVHKSLKTPLRNINITALISWQGFLLERAVKMSSTELCIDGCTLIINFSSLYVLFTCTPVATDE